MEYSQWVERWKAALTACDQLGGEARELIVGPPASNEEVLAVEKDLGVILPPSFRAVLLEFSSAVGMTWYLPDGLRPPDKLRGIFSGECSWSLAETISAEKARSGWAEACFKDRSRPYDAVWHNKVGFSNVPNGDVIAFDLSVLPDSPVVYLSHDDGEGHGYRLGDNFADYINRLSLLGCPGNEDWQMMPFLSDPANGINPYGENARKWRQWFGLNVEVNEQ